MQAIPAVHDAHAPLLQTRFVPQEAPLATFPDSVQTATPVSQATTPVRQGLLATVQAAPVWQDTQAPLALQTLFVPQVVPTATIVFLSLHTGAPVEQVSVPWWQALAGTQAAPVWQAVHCPSRQTMSEPQVVPFAWLPLSVQTADPVAQTMAPLWHGLPLNEQAVPAAQATQTPLLQTIASPQTVPFASGHCVSMHESPDTEQTVCPM